MEKDSILTILNEKIYPGDSKVIEYNIAKLHTTTPLPVTVIIERSKKPGPTVLFTAGIHGDEVNGVEIVRQIISKQINKPKCGTIICIPILNMFGFIKMERQFPDGRDLNRVFPGSKSGSLASRLANWLITEIVPHADLIIDFHTGGSLRFNAPQIRIIKDNEPLKSMAEIFGAPFILYSKNVSNSFRSTCYKLGKPILLYEGGRSYALDTIVTNTGVNGAKRILNHYGMLKSKFIVSEPKSTYTLITESKWIRAKFSGMLKPSISIGNYVNKGDVIGNICGPYGKFNHFIKSQYTGYIINVNESPVVYVGDALFHISTKIS